MKKSRLLGAVCASIFSLILMPSHAELVDNGGGLIYDTVLDITWAQPDAERTWDDANAWAAELTLGGVSGWRLPYISVAAGAGPFTGSPVDCNTETEAACQDNELGYMFYHNLSGTLEQSILTSGDPDLALFPTLQGGFFVDGEYWSGTEFDAGCCLAWAFRFGRGVQGKEIKDFLPFSWAVHAGNVGVLAEIITIDIKPGGDPNSINLKSQEKLPVAILYTELFDATQVDWETVLFGPKGATESHGRAHVKDVDGDGDMDMLLHFNNQDTGIQCGDTEATLTGDTFGGEAITGSDSIVTVKCN